MKTIAGAASFAWVNRSRTREAPTPTIASTNSDAAIEKNGAFASPATARARSVLPMPGGPARRTPRGIRPPSLRYRSGWRRKSTTSESSSLASSIPATSLNVTRSLDAWYRLARERPNEPSTFCTFPARRIRKKRSATKRIVGPKKRSRLCHQGEPVSSGCALTTTPLLWRSFESASLSANAGISVLNRSDGFESRYCCFSKNSPWIAVPFDVIDFTWPSRTCWRKYGLYGTRGRDGSFIAREPRKMFSARSARKKSVHLRLSVNRGGLRGEEPRGAGGAPGPWRWSPGGVLTGQH